jgi:hypothetical protein
VQGLILVVLVLPTVVQEVLVVVVEITSDQVAEVQQAKASQVQPVMIPVLDH